MQHGLSQNHSCQLPSYGSCLGSGLQQGLAPGFQPVICSMNARPTRWSSKRQRGRCNSNCSSQRGQAKIKTTVRYLGIEVEDALSLAEATEVRYSCW